MEKKKVVSSKASVNNAEISESSGKEVENVKEMIYLECAGLQKRRMQRPE